VIVRPLFRSLSRPLFRALSGAVSVITKVLIDLSPTSNGFYSLGADSVLTTAYKLGISTVLPTASTTYALYGRASSATDYFKILSSGYLSLDVNGTVVTSTALATKDSEYREYSVTLDGNDFVFRENTTVISTVTNATAAAKTLTLNLIGNSNGANFYLGILADAVMGAITFSLDNLTGNTETSNGVTLTYNNIGTDVRDTYSLIDGFYFGSQKVINGALKNGAPEWQYFGEWTILNDTATRINGSLQDFRQINILTIGETYQLSVDVLALESGGSLGIWNNSVITIATTTGKATINFTSLLTRLTLLSSSAITIDNISAKRVIEVA
jgi:hypothetical protein